MSDVATRADAAEFRLSAHEPRSNFWWTVPIFAVVALWVTFEDGGRKGLFTVGLFIMILAVQYWFAERATATAEADRSVHLRIDGEGVEIAGVFDRKAPWEAIDKLSITSSRHGDYFGMRIDNPGAYGWRPTGLVALFGSASGRRWVNYEFDKLEGDDDELIAALRRYAPARLSEGL
ncbi:MAG: hypothetical protein IPL88_16290 [Rhizobiales bacterium]|nr:hypothetical protein [Hyphomicrobiales bacterium]